MAKTVRAQIPREDLIRHGADGQLGWGAWLSTLVLPCLRSARLGRPLLYGNVLASFSTFQLHPLGLGGVFQEINWLEWGWGAEYNI